MTTKVLVPLAPGFEEIEAITIIDVLRRAEVKVTTAALADNPVTGSHNITITADTVLDKINAGDYNFIVLPGGMPGSQHLKDSSMIINLIQEIYNSGGHAAAICAAPMVLGHAGVVKGKKATCYPGFEDQLTGAEIFASPFIADDRIITGKGAGCAIPFALKLVEVIKGKAKADAIRDALQVYWM